jgi:hypothetical protein
MARNQNGNKIPNGNEPKWHFNTTWPRNTPEWPQNTKYLALKYTRMAIQYQIALKYTKMAIKYQMPTKYTKIFPSQGLPKQGDQIERIFAFWVTVHFG